MKTAGRAKFSLIVLMLIVMTAHVLLMTPFGFSFCMQRYSSTQGPESWSGLQFLSWKSTKQLFAALSLAVPCPSKS